MENGTAGSDWKDPRWRGTATETQTQIRSQMRPRRKSRRLVLAGVFALLGLSTAVCWYFGRRPMPRTVLTQQETELIAEQLGVRFHVAPTRIRTWFSNDGLWCELQVRADFAGRVPECAFDGEWFKSPGQVQSGDPNRAFQSIVPGFLSWAGELWTALPLLPGDLVFRESKQETGFLQSDAWALVRKNNDGVTLYVTKTQDRRQLQGWLLNVLRQEPVDIGWGGPSQGNLYLRGGGTAEGAR